LNRLTKQQQKHTQFIFSSKRPLKDRSVSPIRLYQDVIMPVQSLYKPS